MSLRMEKESTMGMCGSAQVCILGRLTGLDYRPAFAGSVGALRPLQAAAQTSTFGSSRSLTTAQQQLLRGIVHVIM
jgi:hypothetical protein